MGYENCESGWNDLGNQKRGKTEEEKLKGFKLLILDPVNIHGTPKRPESFVAADMIGAGIGETVLCVSGSSARSAAGDMNIPVDATVVAILDDMEVAR